MNPDQVSLPAPVIDDWVRLKQKRTGKSSRAGAGDGHNAAQLQLHYDDLPSSLSIQDVRERGRGIIATSDIHVGSSMLNTRPFVAVLDNANLKLRCTTCHVAESEMNIKQALLQCSLCHVVKYCSKMCQKTDWKEHKFECKALIEWKARRKEAGHKTHEDFPDTPLRALARVLWTIERDGEQAKAEFDSLLSLGTTENLDSEQTDLMFALMDYIGHERFKTHVPSAQAWVRLYSQFQLNSFALTTPYLDTVGVAISPLVALFNHSCIANAVVVFPSVPSTSNQKYMRVVAIKPIKRGQEVVTSYIDPLLPKWKRQMELKSRYKFDCRCELCEPSETTIDLRERFRCQRADCEGSSTIPDGERSSGTVRVPCGTCGEILTIDFEKDLRPLIDQVEKILTSSRYGAANDAVKILELLKHATQFLKPSSYPIPSLLQVLLTSLLENTKFVEALSAANQLIVALDQIYGEAQPHPTKAVVVAAIAKLRVASRDEGDVEKYFCDGAGLEQTVYWCRRAVQEVERAFGTTCKLGDEMRALESTTTQAFQMSAHFSRNGQDSSS